MLTHYTCDGDVIHSTKQDSYCCHGGPLATMDKVCWSEGDPIQNIAYFKMKKIQKLSGQRSLSTEQKRFQMSSYKQRS